jgi:transposase InsO family protein
MKAIAHERRRFGYRRVHILLKQEGYAVNHKKLFRLYREEKLAVRRRGSRKRAIGAKAPMLIPLAPPTSVGASISSQTNSPTDVVSAFSRSSTTAPANAWRWQSTPHSRAFAWRGNWIASSVYSKAKLLLVTRNIYVSAASVKRNRIGRTQFPMGRLSEAHILM